MITRVLVEENKFMEKYNIFLDEELIGFDIIEKTLD